MPRLTRHPLPMLGRFCAYGFLKNQQYYEPFLILAFLEKGLSFLEIGLLIGFREIAINLIEMPSGAAADLYGRRRAMILSFCAYIVSFVTFALADDIGLLFLAMLFFATGEAFRTGTHKAMIFDWLRRQGRADEKTRVYGLTRSWSKTGSALSALIAAALVFRTGRYESIFWFCIIPYTLNIVNFLGYPKYLDAGVGRGTFSFAKTIGFTWRAIRTSFSRPELRRLLAESMVMDGVYKVAKDYLQPVLKHLALGLSILAALPFLTNADETQRGAVLVGGSYCVLFLLMAIASRGSHRLCRRAGGEDRATRALWWVNGSLFAGLTAALLFCWTGAAVVCFILLGVVQNLFRPAQIARYDAHTPRRMQATILSAESQSKTLLAAVAAPVVGLAVDLAQIRHPGSGIQAFWPVAALGLVLCAAILFTRQRALRN